MKIEKKLRWRLYHFEDHVMPTMYEWIDNRKSSLLRALLTFVVKIIGFAVAMLLLAFGLLLNKPWFRISLYIFFAFYTKFVFEPVQTDWEQVGSRAQSWAATGALLGLMANLPYFLFLRLSNSGNFFVDFTLSVADEALSSNKNKVEKKSSPWLTILYLSIAGGALGAITILVRQFRLQNIFVVIVFICLDLIATAIIQKLFGKKKVKTRRSMASPQ